MKPDVNSSRGNSPRASAEAMGPLDALFLHVEDGISHMHIGSCAVFIGPPPTLDEVRRLVTSKLPLLHRYRQRVKFVPLDLGHPVWIDDVDFDVDFHVRTTAIPSPGNYEQLETLMARLMSQELDRARPLWETWIVEGLKGDRWALISKVHHCMVDGVSGTDLMAALLDADKAAEPVAAERWVPGEAPSDLRLAADGLAHLAAAPIRQAREWWSAGIHPLRTLEQGANIATGLLSFAAGTMSRSLPLSIEGSIGKHRRWAAARCAMTDIKTIRTAFGGTVNDVVLSAVTGAFRSILLARGDALPPDAVLRTLVPVSVRQADDHTVNNQVSLIIAQLPIGIADRHQRLAAMTEQMSALKSSHEADAGAAVVGIAGLLPPALLAGAVRTVSALLRRNPQQIINTVTTNVPGPRRPLYALGREMVEYLPFVPLSEGVRIGVAITSYNGRIAFGVTGDYDTAPDVATMAKQIEEEIDALTVDALSRLSATSAR